MNRTCSRRLECGIALAALMLAVRGSHTNVSAEAIQLDPGGRPAVRVEIVDSKPGHPAWIDVASTPDGYALHVVFADRPNFVVRGAALDDACRLIRDLADRRASDVIDGATRARLEAWFGDDAQTLDSEACLELSIKADAKRDRSTDPRALVHSTFLVREAGAVFVNQLAAEFGDFTQQWQVIDSGSPEDKFDFDTASEAIHAAAQLHAEALGLTA